MEKKEKNPFKEFAEKANKIRKRPLSQEAILEINQISEEIEKEDTEKQHPNNNRKIAGKPMDANL